MIGDVRGLAWAFPGPGREEDNGGPYIGLMIAVHKAFDNIHSVEHSLAASKKGGRQVFLDLGEEEKRELKQRSSELTAMRGAALEAGVRVSAAQPDPMALYLRMDR